MNNKIITYAFALPVSLFVLFCFSAPTYAQQEYTFRYQVRQAQQQVRAARQSVNQQTAARQERLRSGGRSMVPMRTPWNYAARLVIRPQSIPLYAARDIGGALLRRRNMQTPRINPNARQENIPRRRY
jgi:hypothetical protein